MKFNEIKTEEKVRLDPKCWTGKKIGNPKTKVKSGVRVNNCVPAESVAEDAVADFVARGGQIQKGKLHEPRKGETWQGSSHIGAAGGRGTKGTVSGRAANTNPKGGKPVVSAEGYNPEYDDEAGMDTEEPGTAKFVNPYQQLFIACQLRRSQTLEAGMDAEERDMDDYHPLGQPLWDGKPSPPTDA
jgi:hypothetical protein